MSDATERAEIERRATDVLHQAAAYNVPVDLAKVAQFLDVSVHYDALEDKVSGVLVIRGGARHALINGTHHSNRQRFSLAHEVGHLVLHDAEGDRLFIDTNMRVYQRVGAPTDAAYSQADSSTKPHEEREANQFASSLLMPEDLVRKESKNLDLADEYDVAYLARRFGVSDQAMSIRLQQLDLIKGI
jgi:predicted transcriptional regulator